jgi:hypothetical protein
MVLQEYPQPKERIAGMRYFIFNFGFGKSNQAGFFLLRQNPTPGSDHERVVPLPDETVITPHYIYV